MRYSHYKNRLCFGNFGVFLFSTFVAEVGIVNERYYDVKYKF